MYKHKVISDCGGTLILAIYTVSAEVSDADSTMSFDMELDENKFFRYEEASVIVINREKRVLKTYCSCYIDDLLGEYRYDEIDPADEEVRDHFLQALDGEYDDMASKKKSNISYVSNAQEGYKGYDEIVKHVYRYVPECRDMGKYNEYELSKVLTHAYGFVKYPVYGDVLEHSDRTTPFAFHPHLINEFMEEVSRLGLNPEMETIASSLGFEIGSLDVYNTDSIKRKIYSHKMKKKLEVAGLDVCIMHSDNGWKFLYEDPSESIWQSIKKIMELSGKDMETVVKFVMRTPYDDTNLDMLEDVLKKAPGLVRWSHRFDNRTKKLYGMVQRKFMTEEQAGDLVKSPTMGNFLKIMDQNASQK